MTSHVPLPRAFLESGDPKLFYINIKSSNSYSNHKNKYKHNQTTLQPLQNNKNHKPNQTINTMPNYSFGSSFGFTFSSSTSSRDGQTQASGCAYCKEYRSDPLGASTRVTTQRLGERPVQKVRYYDAFGRELLGDGTRPAQAERDRGQAKGTGGGLDG
jgi:hypothetical protein